MTIEYKDSKRIVALSSEALVAHLKFNDNVTDSAGSNNGTVTGTTTYVTGKVGKAFSFNGSSYITLANESNFDFERTDSFSVSFWMKTSTSQDIKMLLGKSELNTTGWHIWLRQGSGSTGDIHFNLTNTDATNELEVRIQSLATFDDNWHHVVFTYDGTSDVTGVTGYFDNSVISNGTVSNTLTSSILNNLPVSIGDTPNGGARDYTGSMDDVRIYSRKLDQSEVTMIYNSGNGTEENKPTNVQDNSLLVQKDTARRYWFESELAPTFENDFSSDNMLDQNSSRIGISSGVLNFDARRGSFNHASSWDIGSTLNDTKWSMRFKMVISTLTQQNDTCRCFIGMSSLPSSSDSNATHDFIGFHAKISSANNDWKAIDTNGASIDIEGTDFGDIATGTYYVEIIRKSATTYSIRITTNSDYTGTSGGGFFDGTLGSGTNCSGSADTVNLRYFWIGNVNAGGTENARFIGTIDDMKIYNGVTSVTPATWTMQPTKQFDFSSSTGWVPVGSNISITGGVIQASAMVTQTDNRIYYDLGSALSDKFVIDFDHYADSSPAGSFWQMFALTDTTAIPRTDDGIYPLIDMGSWDTYLRYSNEGSETNLGTLGSLTTGQWQYVRFVRDGTTGTLTVYSDSARTTQVLNVSGTIPATVTGLRYFQSGALASANTGTATYKIDNLKIYDGVTSIN